MGKEYAVMFTAPGTNECGTPEGAALLEKILACDVNDDGYLYAVFGPKTRENLKVILERLQSFEANEEM